MAGFRGIEARIKAPKHTHMPIQYYLVNFGIICIYW